MKQVVVGVYGLGADQVELVLREDTGGEFYVQPEKGKIPRIKVGADHEEWGRIVAVLLHEAFELALHRSQCRFLGSDDMGRDHSEYLFVMRHYQFSDACAKAGYFLSDALPDLSGAWKKWKNRGAKK